MYGGGGRTDVAVSLCRTARTGTQVQTYFGAVLLLEELVDVGRTAFNYDEISTKPALNTDEVEKSVGIQRARQAVFA